MDVNGTRFHLLLGASDWLGGIEPPDGIAWNDDTRALELGGLPFIFPPRRAETPPGPQARRGGGRDRFGNWYWIDEDERTVLAHAPRDAAPRRFWPAAPPAGSSGTGEFGPAEPAAAVEARRLRGLAVTTEHYLVAGMLEPAGILVFDLAAGGAPLVLDWPDGVPFAPYDIAATADGGVWILDLDHDRMWSLDRQFRVRAAQRAIEPAPEEPEFVPVDPPEPADEPTPSGDPAQPVTLRASVDVSAVPDLAAVEALPDGSALLLGRDITAAAPALYRYTLAGADGVFRLAAQLAPHAQVRSMLTRAHDHAFVPTRPADPERVEGTLYLVAPNGNQAFAFRADGTGAELTFRFVQAFYPMRRFGGRGVVAAGGEPHYDSGDRWVSLLEQPRPRFRGDASLELPAGAGGAFDGRTPGCVWHRLFLDACIPPGTSVTVESRAADGMIELAAEAWQTEPKPYLRAKGSELPWQKPVGVAQATGSGTWELLFQGARGRYLQLRLRLQGNGRNTPRLHALRVYYPRFSYLREYLPAVWREDTASASFVDRFLANVEGTFTEIEGRIAGGQVLFDRRTVPPEFLDWLAAWLGASLDAAWDERKRRFFLANAMRMFAARGTRAGLVRALRLALEECPDPRLFDTGADATPAFGVRIIEKFLGRSAPGVAYDSIGSGLPGTITAGRWSPAQGAEPLHARWRSWLAARYDTPAALDTSWGTSFESFENRGIRLRATAPTGTQGSDWRQFVLDALDFTYAIPESADLPLWRDFLARRYPDISDLNRAWRRFGTARLSAFSAASFPAELPAGGAELGDWIAFVSVVLPMRRGAHQFTVLVPVRLDDPPEVQRTRRALAERLAQLEKPAHTVVDSRLYWAAFQVGTARLGADSVLGQGSRFSTLVLGRGELAHAYLGWTEPWNVRGRRVVGRDTVRLQPQGSPARCS